MENHQDIDMVFFDIGGTLGERHPTTGLFKPFPSSAGLLKAMRRWSVGALVLLPPSGRA